jgi:hypothetical protein
MEPDITKDEARLPACTDTRRRLRRWLPVSIALALTLMFGSADAWAKASVNAAPPAPSESASQTDPVSAGAPAATPGSAADYANREAGAPGLEKFEGGDLVIIGSGGLILVLLIVVLILVL